MSTLNVKSTQQPIKVGAHKGEDMYVMKVEHYSTMDAEKIINYASRSECLPEGALRAAWGALGNVIATWVLEGHIVEIPGLGNIRAEIRAKAQKNAKDVSADDVIRRHLLLTPTIGIKRELNNVSLDITCYDKKGHEVMRKAASESEDYSRS